MSEREKLFDYHQRLAEHVIKSTPRALFGFAVLALIYAFSQRAYVPLYLLLVWCGCVAVFIALRAWNSHVLSIAISNNDASKANLHVKILFYICIYSAFVWSSMSLLTISYAPSPFEFLPLIMVILIIFGAAYSLASFQFIFMFFATFLMLFQAIILLYLGGEFRMSVAFILMFSMPILRNFASSLYDHQLEVIELNGKLENANDQLHLQANTDALTNVYNRRYFFDAGDKLFSLSRREKKNFSLLMLDLDKFKSVNDNYGHQAGDAAIVEIANFIKNRLRDSDILARVGGEEFAVILNNSDIGDATRVADELCRDISQTDIQCSGLRFRVTVSIGVVEAEQGTKSLLSLYGEADKRLYKAKNNGRNQVCSN